MKGVVETSFKLNLTVMKILGLYPFENYPHLYKIYAPTVYAFAMLPGSILGFIQLFFKRDTDGVKYDDLISMVVIFQAPKFLSVVVNGSNIRKCINYFDEYIFVKQSAKHENIVENCVSVCRRNSNVFFFGCVASIFSWCGQLYFRGKNDDLPVNVWMPLSLKQEPVFNKFLYFNLVIGICLLDNKFFKNNSILVQF